MLVSLTIRNIISIESLSIEFGTKLCALTGETGAGKSILLDALGAALGERMEGNLLRPGADDAEVTAIFTLAESQHIAPILADVSIKLEGDLILRRKLSSDGRSRAHINDRAVTVGTLRRVGRTLVEMQGQFDNHGLADESTHQDQLDRFAHCQPGRRVVRERFRALAQLREKLVQARATRQAGTAEIARLQERIQQLEVVGAYQGEVASLISEREMLTQGEKLAQAFLQANALLRGSESVDFPQSHHHASATVEGARRALERVAAWLGEGGRAILAALDRAAAEIEEAGERIEALQSALDHEPERMARIEDRLFTLREVARKLSIDPDELSEAMQRDQENLATISGRDDVLGQLEAEQQAVYAAYLEAARKLRKRRVAGAKALEGIISAELPELRLGQARFRVVCNELAEADYHRNGIDQVSFQIATLPDTEPGPIGRVASGGERSRLLLALKAALGAGSSATTLVFDEVDSGVGGATVAAVGRRIAKLAQLRQVLAVTHSPQVAASADQHWRVERLEKLGRSYTSIRQLNSSERREEIARMLSGSTITEAARAAANSLLGESQAARRQAVEHHLAGQGRLV